MQFAFGVMTRAKAITYDNLRLRAPEFVAAIDRHFAQQVREAGFDVDTQDPQVPMFQPFRLREMVVGNRVVMSPMCMYSAKDGLPGDWHMVHYGFARHRRAGADVHRDDLHLAAGADHDWLCRAVERCAAGSLDAHRRFCPCQFTDEDLPATRPCRGEKVRAS